jgi:NADPH:quinone reductase-like Zn-dependent oxidoreductase
MALGVEAAGLVAAVGTSNGRFAVGDRVAAHSAPLREQGAWAEWFIVPTAHCGVLPPDVSFEVAAALPVPALITSLTGPGKCACWPAEASTRRPTRPGRAPATR